MDKDPVTKGWHRYTGIALVTGIIIFVNVLKGQWNALKCALLSEEPITTLFTYHDYYPPWHENHSGLQRLVVILFKWLGSMFWPRNRSSPPTGKYRHLKKLFFRNWSPVWGDQKYKWITSVPWSMWEVPCVPCGLSSMEPHYAEVLKPSRAFKTQMQFKHLSVLYRGLFFFFYLSLQPHSSPSRTCFSHTTLTVGSQCAMFSLSSRPLNTLWTLPIPSFAAPVCSPGPLWPPLAYSSFEYQCRCDFLYKAFPELPKSEVNALPECALKTHMWNFNTATVACLLTCLFH